MYTAGMLPWDVIETLKTYFSYRATEKKIMQGGGGGLNQWLPNKICITNNIQYAKLF